MLIIILLLLLLFGGIGYYGNQPNVGWGYYGWSPLGLLLLLVLIFVVLGGHI